MSQNTRDEQSMALSQLAKHIDIRYVIKILVFKDVRTFKKFNLALFRGCFPWVPLGVAAD